MTSDEDDLPINPQPIETVSKKNTTNFFMKLLYFQKKNKASTKTGVTSKVPKTASSSTAQKKRKSSNTSPHLPVKRKRNSSSLDLSDSPAGGVTPAWSDAELLSEKTQTPEEVAQNLIKLWEEGNTIPFIARYRKNAIGNLTPDALRTVKESYDEICTLKRKMCTVVKTVKQLGKLDNKLQGNICAARTIEELDHLVRIV